MDESFGPGERGSVSLRVSSSIRHGFSRMQRTLIIFKPDAVQRRLVGRILERFESKGLRIGALKLIRVDQALAERHYAEHQGRPFFPGLISFITSGPVVVGVLEGNEAISVVRGMLGATSGVAAAPGTVRGDSRSASRTTSCTAATAQNQPSGRLPSGSEPKRSSTTLWLQANGFSMGPEPARIEA